MLSDLKYEEKDIMNDMITSDEKMRNLRKPGSYIIRIKILTLSA